MPLHEADPRQLGPFRLSDRVGASAEGVVYSGRDSRGRRVSVAMLSSGAAADPAARDRFAAAVRGGKGVADPPKVLASSLASPAASWVAVRGGGPRGAEAFLEPVAVAAGASAGAEAAPSYAPYWSAGGNPGPAAAAWSWASVGHRRGAGSPARPGWPVVVALLVALLLIAVVVVAVFLLLQNMSVQASQPPPQPSSGQGSPSAGPSGGSDGPPQPPPQEPTPASSPSGDVPSVDVDEDDYPAGEVPAEPEDQA
ncbi:hypothetical protein [Streptomonospora wellingtoniae]|uniref:Serine/threonine protein kinase n=1 Tax=Streptomonospora wellingtoniae TaxID=3075544 RepID=A0ABU2KX26_9ACTN|nr:hypothetical protein [Streptomonospora sp. DSM 45055]MDT0303795.1 hypothetical protein [Streptomonospora sp. DSM 45055]